jgi:hypothetical protein
LDSTKKKGEGLLVDLLSSVLIKLSCCSSEQVDSKQGVELLQDILTSSQWVKSDKLSAALKSPLMRLCARYAKGHLEIWKCYQYKISIIHYT